MKRSIILIIGILLALYSCKQQGQQPQTAKACLEEAEHALQDDSTRLGETLLRQAIRQSESEGDWHTYYISYQRLAATLSQGNAEKALQLMKKALQAYEQHPDDERNHIILLDYAGTYAAQVAYASDESYDEALGFIEKAYELAAQNRITDLMVP